MNAEQIRQKIRSIAEFAGARISVWPMHQVFGPAAVATYTAEIYYEVAEDVTIGYDALAKLAAALETNKIDVVFDAGWAGTEVTPGDPAEFKIVVKLGY